MVRVMTHTMEAQVVWALLSHTDTTAHAVTMYVSLSAEVKVRRRCVSVFLLSVSWASQQVQLCVAALFRGLAVSMAVAVLWWRLVKAEQVARGLSHWSWLRLSCGTLLISVRSTGDWLIKLKQIEARFPWLVAFSLWLSTLGGYFSKLRLSKRRLCFSLFRRWSRTSSMLLYVLAWTLSFFDSLVVEFNRVSCRQVSPHLFDVLLFDKAFSLMCSGRPTWLGEAS